MIFNNLPDVYMIIKKRFKGNHIIKSDDADVFFALTPQAVEDVVLKKYKSFNKSGGFKRLRSVVGQGILTSDEPKHLKNKKLLSKAFSNNKLKEYEPKMINIIDSLLSNWSDEVNVRYEMGHLAYRSIMEIFFSETTDDKFLKIKNNINDASDKVGYGTDNYELEPSVAELKSMSKEIVDKRLESKQNNNDFLDMLISLYKNKIIDMDDLYDEAITLLLSSYETTAYVFEWAVYYLSINKKWQQLIYEEKNMNAFISEVLRLSPPIWNSERVAIEDVDIDGTRISAGTEIKISSLIMHRDSEVFEDPDDFKPERWLVEKELSKGEYFPFLFGKRQCIGKDFAWMELQILLRKICDNFEIELVTENPGYMGALTYRPKNEIVIKVTKKPIHKDEGV